MWRLAKSLEQLRTQLNAAFPNRSKVSDGSIGDQAHSARVSDHNPVNGVVHAIDVTNDPVGPTGHTLSRQLINDSRVKYVIFAGEIWKARTGQWEQYRGANRHDHHVHVSVKAESADNVSPWLLNGTDALPGIPKSGKPVLKVGSKGLAVRELQSKLRVEVDGEFGFTTERAVKRFQLAHGLKDDGIFGPASWAALGE